MINIFCAQARLGRSRLLAYWMNNKVNLVLPLKEQTLSEMLGLLAYWMNNKVDLVPPLKTESI